MQSVLELTLALKVAPDTAVVKKKTFKADTNSLQAHIRDELYDTAEPNNIKLPAPFWETTGHIYISCLLPST